MKSLSSSLRTLLSFNEIPSQNRFMKFVIILSEFLYYYNIISCSVYSKILCKRWKYNVLPVLKWLLPILHEILDMSHFVMSSLEVLKIIRPCAHLYSKILCKRWKYKMISANKSFMLQLNFRQMKLETK